MKKRFTALLLILTFIIASSATSFAASNSIRVAVIDTGISPSVISESNISEGKNYIRPGDDCSDRVGHGTAVSAFIVGMANGKIKSICPTAELVPLVFYSKDDEGKVISGDTSMVAEAVYDAVDVYKCKIINISSGSAEDTASLRKAVDYANKKGVIVIASAGNGGNKNLYYPAAYESVLCVGSCEEGGTPASFSQDNETVDLLAKGTDLSVASLNGSIAKGQGTSYSTALVSGTAAQLWTLYPELTADQLRELLLSACGTVEGRKVLDPDDVLKAASGMVPLPPAGGEAPPTVDNPPAPPTISFEDVASDAYYRDAVIWASGSGITSGTDAGIFSPDLSCTRAQMVTFLWRSAGSPAASSSNPFSDVEKDAYYYDAVLWAVEKGITGGVGEGMFAPDTVCSRAQMAAFLYRMADSPQVSGISAFADIAEGAYYETAVLWAAENNITQGTGPTTFGPDEDCTRAQIVSFLYRYYQ